MLTFTPSLAGLESLDSHRSTLESFGKKVDEKTKALRSAEMLFGVKKAEWDETEELAAELLANSQRIVVLSEGLCETLFRAIVSSCQGLAQTETGAPVTILSSSVQGEALKSLASALIGKRFSLIVGFEGQPSDRLVLCFRVLLDALSQGRHPEEVARRVIVSTGQAASPWERWAQGSSYRNVSFPHRCAGRYLFFSQPTALLLHLLGFTAWRFVEGGRSFFRQYDKAAETEDPILAYSALREVQLAEHNRETLVLPDNTFQDFGRWWRVLTEDSRKLFCEESSDALVWTGSVMRDCVATDRLHWVTEIAVESTPEMALEHLPAAKDAPPFHSDEIGDWQSMEDLYRGIIREHRAGSEYSQSGIRIGLRRRDPYCLGTLFAFFESVVCASHKLAETSDSFGLCIPYKLATSGAAK